MTHVFEVDQRQVVWSELEGMNALADNEEPGLHQPQVQLDFYGS